MTTRENLMPCPTELLENLAAVEHQRWSDWHIHMISNNNPENMARWNRQAVTAYKDLSEREKESDRKEVMRYWPLIAAWQNDQLRLARECLEEIRKLPGHYGEEMSQMAEETLAKMGDLK